MLKNVKVFSGEDTHGTCAFVWTIFYPKNKIPEIIQILDIDDSKKHAKFIYYSGFVANAIGLRYTFNPKISRKK